TISGQLAPPLKSAELWKATMPLVWPKLITAARWAVVSPPMPVLLLSTSTSYLARLVGVSSVGASVSSTVKAGVEPSKVGRVVLMAAVAVFRAEWLYPKKPLKTSTLIWASPGD